MATRKTSHSGSLRHGTAALSQQTSSRTRFRRSVVLILVPLASSTATSIEATRLGSAVSRVSAMVEPALMVWAEKFLVDSAEACSKKEEMFARNDSSLKTDSGTATAEPGKSH